MVFIINQIARLVTWLFSPVARYWEAGALPNVLKRWYRNYSAKVEAFCSSNIGAALLGKVFSHYMAVVPGLAQRLRQLEAQFRGCLALVTDFVFSNLGHLFIVLPSAAVVPKTAW